MRRQDLLPALATALSAASWATAAVVPQYWNITYTTANPDGLSERRVIGVNDTWPPPIMIVNQGDVLEMHATNGLNDTVTSLHHHGMYFNGTSYFDGAVGVSQCGIPPGEEFTYVVDTTNQIGTYWVHSHFNGQLVDGLRAPFIIQPVNKTGEPAYDDEYIIIVSDWYHDQHADLLSQFMSKDNPGGAEPVPDSAAIYVANAQGQYLPGFNENATIPFTPGKTYRLRILNTGAFAMFFLKIDGHQMSVVETDGTTVEPYPVDSLTITVAQRYSVLVTARNDTSSNFLLQAMYDTDMFDTVPDGLQTNYTATVQYDPAAPVAPPVDFTSFEMTSQNDTDFVPVDPVPIYPKTTQIELNVFFDTFADGTNRAAFNNITYVLPITPTVMTVNSMINNTNTDIYGPQSHALLLNHLDVVELRVVNWDAGKHPFHLHGHKFQIVGKQEDVTADPADIDEGQTNPIRRDTVQIPSLGSATLRFVVDNPGVWLFHCHIDWHLSSGLAVTFVAAPQIMYESDPIPSFLLDQCSAQGISPTGNAAGLNSYTDLTGAPYGPFPQVMGFGPAGIGALFACCFTAVLGIATMVWYVTGEQFDEREMEEEEKIRQQAKQNRSARIKGAFNRVTARS